jgi:DNA-binding NarL/FixJ family response regulator
VLLDVVMPGNDGPDWSVKFCEHHGHLPVLLVSGLAEMDVRARFAKCSNVLGLIAKARPNRDLKLTIENALAGKPQWRAVADCVLPTYSTSIVRFEQLTRKQILVARLVCMGLTNREVAQELDIQEGTVKNHLKDIFTRLGVTNRTQLALSLPSQT